MTQHDAIMSHRRRRRRPGRLRDVWSGAVSDPVAETMVTGTAAVALKAMGRAATQDEAQVLAETFWHERDKAALKGAAKVSGSGGFFAPCCNPLRE